MLLRHSTSVKPQCTEAIQSRYRTWIQRGIWTCPAQRPCPAACPRPLTISVRPQHANTQPPSSDPTCTPVLDSSWLLSMLQSFFFLTQTAGSHLMRHTLSPSPCQRGRGCCPTKPRPLPGVSFHNRIGLLVRCCVLSNPWSRS